MKPIAPKKQAMHFTESYLLNPYNPVTISLIGSGSTGSRVLTTLAETNHTLRALGHPGFDVQLFDNDIVTEANLGKQRFAQSEVGLEKCVARINNINRWFGTDWKAVPYKYTGENLNLFRDGGRANIFISCVDNVPARFDVAAVLQGFQKADIGNRYKPYYWMDYGNSRYTGQVILSTVGKIEQPKSKKYRTVGTLPFITDEFADLLRTAEKGDDTPSCSVREAIEKQDLFINGALAQYGATLLFHLFRNMMTQNRGVFMNLAELRTQPLRVG